MIDHSTLKKIDSEKMFEVYDKWPEIALKSYVNILYVMLDLTGAG